MWVDFGEVEFAGDQEEHGAHGGEAYEAAGLALGCLEQAVYGFDKAVGLTSLRPRHDAVEMTTNHLCDFLHGLDLRAHHVGTPLIQGLPD